MIGPTTVQTGSLPVRRLGEVVEFLDHLRKPITAADRQPGPVPYYGANGQQDSVEGWLFDEPLVLLAEDGGHFKNPHRGIAYQIDGKSWVNNHAHVLRVKDEIESRWLARVLENYDVSRFLTGSTRAKLTKSGASRIPIPVPPIEDQRRIAGVLDAGDALRAKRRQALDTLSALTKSIFIDMFGPSVGPYAASSEKAVARSGYEVQPLGTLVTFLDHMRKPITASERVPGPYPYYGANGKQDDVDGFLFDEPLVLLAEDGGHFEDPSRGVAYAIDGKAWVNNHAHVLRPGPSVSIEFLTSYLRHQHLEKFLTGTTRGKLTKGSAVTIPVPLPSIAEQEAYSRAVVLSHAYRAQADHQAERCQALFLSLQHRAFRGEL